MAAMVQEVPRRYVEQLQTTVETMRRRGLAVYDGIFRIGNRSATLIEKAREVVEPAAYDVKDFVVSAVGNMEPLPENNRDLRNNLLELYLGISVLTLGLSAGSISGATFVGSIFSTLVNPFIELASLFAIPGYAYYQFKKNAGIDETERRVWLFAVAFFIGAIFGHALGARLLSTVPSVLFILPMTLALLIDYELAPRDLFADRQRLVIAASGLGGIVAYVLSYFVAGFAMGPIFAIVANSALLWIHFQITNAAQKNQNITSTDLQFGYIIAALLVQVLIAVILGNGKFGQHYDN
uniref:Uncharacterized protein n=1 Tax=Panagrolaimus sp. JU765 TaxID=591449 RepID=A0AC34QE63_9BILA